MVIDKMHGLRNNFVDFWARGGFVGLVIEMKKGPDDAIDLSNEAVGLITLGKHRPALEKFTPILAALRLNGHDADAVSVHLNIIACHAGLQEVSWRTSRRGSAQKLTSLSHKHAEVLRECDKLEPIVKRVRGTESFEMALLLRHRSNALRKLGRVSQARAAALESMRISELISGRGEDYARGLYSLAEICCSERDFDAGLNYIQEARSLVSPENFGLLANVLNLETILLKELGRYQEALVVREKEKDLTLRVYGPDHPNYATSLSNIAQLYAELKQMQSAVDLTSKAVAIYMKTYGPSHSFTQAAQKNLVYFRKALTDPDLKNQFASTKNRMCNIDGCNTVEENMNRCSKCLSFYLCEKHKDKINDHVVVCPKFPDVLPDEKKLKKIVKCRRCRKESKLMKCAVCKSVWYCGAQCQKDDWKRHKVFCGKK